VKNCFAGARFDSLSGRRIRFWESEMGSRLNWCQFEPTSAAQNLTLTRLDAGSDYAQQLKPSILNTN